MTRHNYCKQYSALATPSVPCLGIVDASIASALGCNEEYLRGEQELFLTRAAEQYGTRGQQQAQVFLDSTRAMFAGGDLSPEDIDMIGKHFMEMFWEAKENARKYTPKKGA